MTYKRRQTHLLFSYKSLPAVFVFCVTRVNTQALLQRFTGFTASQLS